MSGRVEEPRKPPEMTNLRERCRERNLLGLPWIGIQSKVAGSGNINRLRRPVSQLHTDVVEPKEADELLVCGILFPGVLPLCSLINALTIAGMIPN